MSPDLLSAAGEALYGPRWQSPLQEALDVGDRTMRRWIAGTDPIPDGVWRDLVKLVATRRYDLEQVAVRLDP